MSRECECFYAVEREWNFLFANESHSLTPHSESSRGFREFANDNMMLAEVSYEDKHVTEIGIQSTPAVKQ